MISIKTNNIRNYLLSLLFWVFGGTLFFFIDIIWHTITNNQNHTNIYILILLILLSIPLERFGAELPWNIPLLMQGFISAVGITISQFILGLILNIGLGLNIWDYSFKTFNLLGQISIDSFVLWFIISIFGIILFDILRYYIIGGKKPKYYLW